MNNPSNALRREALSGNTAKFLIALPGFHSYLPAALQAWVRAFHSFCALLITPLSARITVGLGEERGVQSRKVDVVTGFPRDCKWGEARIHPLAHSPLPAFLLCSRGDDSRCCALGKPYGLCHPVRCTDRGMYSFSFL